jgi:tetratricopeptide (TPR) repeat protein
VAAKRIPRKELKKPDEIITFTGRTIQWCLEHKALALRVASGLTILILVVTGAFLYQNYRQRKARRIYNEAVAALVPSPSGGGSSLEAAVTKLEEVRRRYASTKVGPFALADLGNLYRGKGNFDEAVACYQASLKGLERRGSLYGLVLENLGTTYEAKGSWDFAAETYDRLAREGAPSYQAQAQLGLGRVYEAKGDRAKALAHYEAYLKDNPDSPVDEWLRVKVTGWRLQGIS